jgi:uncharacterized HAD superfamily protein
LFRDDFARGKAGLDALSYKRSLLMSVEEDDVVTKFDKYLLQEYSSVAEAHFNTIETISAFFKNYLVVMTFPLALIAYLLKSNEPGGKSAQGLISYISLGGVLLMIIAVAGGAILLYIMNLRFDAILYARTVNGIRKYFYDRADIDLHYKIRMRTLPQSAMLPSYLEGWYFIPVVTGFAFINTLYFAVGNMFFQFSTITFNSYSVIAFVSFFILHYLSYVEYSNQRESGYLKSYIIGIDIDGVLNKHREHFCKLLKRKTGKEVNPEKIIHIPVHEGDLDVTREDEVKVFHSPEYWTEMPIEDNTPENIKKLNNVFKFKIMIFTHRPWPNVKVLDNKSKKELFDEWKNCLQRYEMDTRETLVGSKESTTLKDTINKLLIYINYKANIMVLNHFRKRSMINRFTSLWLKRYEFKFDSLVIEKGHEDVADPRGHFKNRFQISRKKKIKFFVEDDLEKAIKLAYICDAVLLFDHPYNKEEGEIPGNIIRVKSWNELYKTIRKLS